MLKRKKIHILPIKVKIKYLIENYFSSKQKKTCKIESTEECDNSLAKLLSALCKRKKILINRYK